MVIATLLKQAIVTAEGCWVWTGSKAGAGYGTTYVSKRGREYVHRLSYIDRHGSIPEGLEIDHLCRERLCFNPEHLEAVTHAENRRRARRELCHRGHPLADGLEIQGHGRRCRRCDADKKRAARAKARAAA